MSAYIASAAFPVDLKARAQNAVSGLPDTTFATVSTTRSSCSLFSANLTGQYIYASLAGNAAFPPTLAYLIPNNISSYAYLTLTSTLFGAIVRKAYPSYGGGVPSVPWEACFDSTNTQIIGYRSSAPLQALASYYSGTIPVTQMANYLLTNVFISDLQRTARVVGPKEFSNIILTGSTAAPSCGATVAGEGMLSSSAVTASSASSLATAAIVISALTLVLVPAVFMLLIRFGVVTCNARAKSGPVSSSPLQGTSSSSTQNNPLTNVELSTVAKTISNSAGPAFSVAPSPV